MNYKRISVSVPFDGTIDNYTGNFKFSQAMKNRIYDEEEEFREKLIITVNDSVKGKWHIHFTEYRLDYIGAEVFIENNSDFDFIKSILETKFRNNPLESISKKTFRDELFKVESKKNAP